MESDVNKVALLGLEYLKTAAPVICIWDFTNHQLNVKSDNSHCVKIVHIRRFSDPYSVRMPKNTDQKNSEYRYFSRSEY